tara:strand:+ start:50 stop:349 length:300 start_codon:yes stop_codon:yes gene_type:complete
MKKTINFYDFERAFNTDTYQDHFSYEGKKALFEYLEEYEDSTGDQIELDVVALCGDFDEYESLEHFQSDYNDEYTDMETIQDCTSVIMVSEKGFIVQQF